MEPSDGSVVRRVLAGDVDAYAILVGRYRDRIVRYAVHMLGSASDAEDVAQESFVRAFRALARCESPDRFGPWLFRIAVNRCRTAGARRVRRERTIVVDEDAARDASVAHPAEGAAWREEIERALARLDHQQREAFLLKHVEELSYEEISAMTGVGISALKMRVKRACERLRASLEEVERV